ncbi:hypothetical protein [Fodinicola feengrottensis]|uniref:hypothetical protein n=1 Tax=Fodinicola feengrottensis TaxID=435914 RepID=UPI0013D6C435|nr:hypothetical protein [Fodinicola feengrottensis]
MDDLLTDELRLISGLAEGDRDQLAELLKALLAAVHERVDPEPSSPVGYQNP